MTLVQNQELVGHCPSFSISFERRHLEEELDQDAKEASEQREAQEARCREGSCQHDSEVGVENTTEISRERGRHPTNTVSRSLSKQR